MSLFHIANISYAYLFVGSILATYCVIGGFLYWYTYVYKHHAFKKFKIQEEKPTKESVVHDILWSFFTISIWGVFAYFLIVLTNYGYTKIYFTPTYDYELLRGFFLVTFFFVLHDTYYYWSHRLMHSHDIIYKYTHEVHHTTTNPTPLSIFSFSPAEALVHGSYFALICFIFPVHFFVLIIVFTLNSMVNIVGHTGYEFFNFRVTKKIQNFIITPLKHNFHHSYGYKNYGLYFSFWDNVMGTLHENHTKDVDAFYNKKSNSFYANHGDRKTGH